MEIWSTSTLLVMPPSYVRLVIPMEWGKILICLSAPTLLWYKLRLIVGLPHGLESNRLMSNRLICYRLMSYRLVSYRLVSYRLISLGGDVSMNRLCGIGSRWWVDWG